MSSDLDAVRSLEFLEAAESAMTEQLASLEAANAQEWKDAKRALKHSTAAEKELSVVEQDIPKQQMALLKARQDGDSLEFERIGLELEAKSLNEKLLHQQHVQHAFSTSTLTAREESMSGEKENSTRELKLSDRRYVYP